MKVIKNHVLPVLAGLLTGWVVVMILEAVSHAFYPPPADLDYTDKEAMAAFVQTLPTAAFLLLLLAWMAGAFAGGLISGLINNQKAGNNAILVGALLALGSIINMTIIPHPTWLMITASVGYVPFAYTGGIMATYKKSKS